MSFLNKTVLITGASSGIGAETAIHFAKLGASLSLVGRNIDRLSEVGLQCETESKNNKKPLLIIADMQKEADIENIIESTIKKFEGIDVLVNNAGILGNGSIEDTSLEQYDRIMNVNVRSVYYLTMLAVPHLIKTKGTIVNVSSVTGIRSFPNILAYCMSKSAVDQFTRCTALELAPKGVRVNAVNPGVIKTGIHIRGGMNDEAYEEFLEKCKSTHVLGRPGEVWEVASAIVFLAGPESGFITGATLPIDGGRHAMCPR